MSSRLDDQDARIVRVERLARLSVAATVFFGVLNLLVKFFCR